MTYCNSGCNNYWDFPSCGRRPGPRPQPQPMVSSVGTFNSTSQSITTSLTNVALGNALYTSGCALSYSSPDSIIIEEPGIYRAYYVADVTGTFLGVASDTIQVQAILSGTTGPILGSEKTLSLVSVQAGTVYGELVNEFLFTIGRGSTPISFYLQSEVVGTQFATSEQITDVKLIIVKVA